MKLFKVVDDSEDIEEQISDDPDSVFRFDFRPYVWDCYKAGLTIFAFAVAFGFRPLILGQIFFVLFIVIDTFLEIMQREKKRKQTFRKKNEKSQD